MKKKVLYLITKATWGGAQKYVYDLATHLPKNEFSACVAYGTPGRLMELLEKEHIPQYQIPALGRDIALWSDIKSFFQLLKLLRAERPDILHVNSSKAAALGAFAARIIGIKKIVFTVHGWPFLEDRSYISKVFIWIASWLTASLSHRVICISNYDVRLGGRMPFVGNKLTVIHNGISPIRFGSGHEIRKAFPPNAFITGTVGELTKNKNQSALIEQAHANPNMFIAIVGEGEDYAKLQEKIKKYSLESRVKLLGYVPIEEALPGFDHFVLPSIKEGLPYVLLEARQAGLSIEANRVGGVDEILDAKDMDEFSLKRMVEKTIALYLSA